MSRMGFKGTVCPETQHNETIKSKRDFESPLKYASEEDYPRKKKNPSGLVFGVVYRRSK